MTKPLPFVPEGAILPSYAMSPNVESSNAPQSMMAQGLMSLPEMAGAADQALQNVMRVEPMIAGFAGMFIPGLTMVQPWIVMLAPYLEQALNDLSKSNNGAVLPAILELINHLTKGMPNSPALAPLSSSAAAASPMSQNTQFSTADGLDASGNMVRADTPG